MSESIQWFAPKFEQSEIDNVSEVLLSNYINDGETTRVLERKITDFLGCKYGVAVTSGTIAITLSLMALGIEPGDEVIVPDFTFIATANAVRLAGGVVKLVDIEPNNFTLDPYLVERAIGPKTKAVIAVDINGRGADYEALESICKKHGLALVCDSAEALGSKHKNKYLGTYGEVGCFSFSANKTISSGQGGMIVTDNAELYQKLRALKDQGRSSGGTGGNDLHPVLGFNFKYTNLQAAVALAQMNKLSERIDHFKNRDSWYVKELKNCREITFPPLSNESGQVRQWMDLLCKERSKIEAALEKNNIGFRPFWFPLHMQKPYQLPDEGFENSLEISKTGLWLPSSFDLTQQDVKKVCKILQDALY